MEIFFTILIMTLVVSLSGVVTRVLPFQVPLPLMQIAIGALLAWPTFGLHVEFDPELFLVLFIPPLLFADGWKTPTREFIEHGREILGPALALVVVTVVGIGFLIYWIVPGIPLIPAFALAAVLSPTDAVALSGIVGEGRIPKKIMGILQGGGANERRLRPGLAQVCRRGGDGHHGLYRWRRHRRISEGGDWRRAGRVCGELVVWPLDALPQPLGRG